MDSGVSVEFFGGKIQQDFVVAGIGEGFNFIDGGKSLALRNHLPQP